MRTIKGPGVFLAQFASDDAPYNSLAGLAGWAKEKGFIGVQLPAWDSRIIDIEKAVVDCREASTFGWIKPRFT
jgi:hypothetical protein